MNAKIVKYRLSPGGKDGQMKREELYARSQEYIKKLEDNGEKILDIKEEPNEITIILEDV